MRTDSPAKLIWNVKVCIVERKICIFIDTNAHKTSHANESKAMGTTRISSKGVVCLEVAQKRERLINPFLSTTKVEEARGLWAVPSTLEKHFFNLSKNFQHTNSNKHKVRLSKTSKLHQIKPITQSLDVFVIHTGINWPYFVEHQYLGKNCWICNAIMSTRQ